MLSLEQREQLISGIREVIEALVIGAILMDLLCAHFLQRMDRNALADTKDNLKDSLFLGFFGIIELRVWLLFSCVAFLIGIFVQIIWEDKPITEPL